MAWLGYRCDLSKLYKYFLWRVCLFVFLDITNTSKIIVDKSLIILGTKIWWVCCFRCLVLWITLLTTSPVYVGQGRVGLAPSLSKCNISSWCYTVIIVGGSTPVVVVVDFFFKFELTFWLNRIGAVGFTWRNNFQISKFFKAESGTPGTFYSL